MTVDIIEELRRVLAYDPATGVLTWRVDRKRGAIRAGTRAGAVTHSGARHIYFRGKFLPEHRLAFAIVTGRWPEHEIDHVNGQPADNRAVNLREATRIENCRNSRTRSHNGTGLKGAKLDKRRGTYRARIVIHGRETSLSGFRSAEAAHAAYCVLAGVHFGKFARFD